MKKFFYLFVITFCFAISTSAQDKKLNSKELATADAKELAQLVKLDVAQTENFARLFEMKYNYLNENLSEDRKKELTKIIDAKIRATLSGDQMQVLDKNKELLDRLTK